MRFYETSGDNRHTGYYTSFAAAALSLVECAFTEVTPIDIAAGSKAVYHRKTDGMFGASKDQYAYIGWITTEDAQHIEDVPALEAQLIAAQPA